METERKKPISHIAELIVKLRVPIAIAFLALVVFSVFSIRWIKVENDITFYLPEEAEARQGLEIMDEFTTYGTAKVMVRNITAGQAEALKEKLSKVPDVLLVLFDRSEQHYKNSTALFDITFADVEQSQIFLVIAKEDALFTVFQVEVDDAKAIRHLFEKRIGSRADHVYPAEGQRTTFQSFHLTGLDVLPTCQPHLVVKL